MGRDVGTERALWNERYKEGRREHDGPSAFLVKHARLLPREGNALDVACGTGRDATFLSSCGLITKGIDISDVAIDIAKQNVGAREQVTFEAVDALEALSHEPDRQYDVISCLNFFEPALVGDLKRVLKPGGTIILQTFTVNDSRLKDSRVKDVLVTDTKFFEPAMFGGYWMLVHEIENFTDFERLARQRVNMIARKPFIC